MLTVNSRDELKYIYQGLCTLQADKNADMSDEYAWVDQDKLDELITRLFNEFLWR